MTTPEPTPQPRSYIAALWLRESFLREAQTIADPDARAAALAQVDHDYPMPNRTTYRRTR